MKKLGLLDIKEAILGDRRFRELFPELKEDFEKVLHNPGCACNVPFYKKVYKYKDRLQEYFPNRSIQSPDDEAEELSRNNWIVTNCHINELEGILNKMHKIGRKQVAVARYEDQVTLIVNDIGVVF